MKIRLRKKQHSSREKMVEIEVRQRRLSVSVTSVPEEETGNNREYVIFNTKTQENFP